LYDTLLKVDDILPILGRLRLLVGITMKGALWLRNFPNQIASYEVASNWNCHALRGVEGWVGFRIVFGLLNKHITYSNADWRLVSSIIESATSESYP